MDSWWTYMARTPMPTRTTAVRARASSLSECRQPVLTASRLLQHGHHIGAGASGTVEPGEGAEEARWGLVGIDSPLGLGGQHHQPGQLGQPADVAAVVAQAAPVRRV